MSSFTVKNIPESLLRKIKQSSIDNQRSMNSEIIFQLSQSLDNNKKPKVLSLEEIQKLRSSTKGYYLTEEQLSAIRDEGRA